MDSTDGISWAICIGMPVAGILLNTNRVLHAIHLCRECLILLNNKGLAKEKKLAELSNLVIHILLFKAYCFLNDHTRGIDCGRKLLDFLRGLGFRAKEGDVTFQMAKLYKFQSNYKEAKELYKIALTIMVEIGDKKGEAACYGNAGSMSQCLGEYGKAEEYQRKALAIRKEIGDKEGEAACYGNLGSVSQCLGEYGKAEEYQKKALAIRKEIGDKEGEAECYGSLGGTSQCLGEYGRAEEYQKKALAIAKEIGYKEGEASCYGNLGSVSQCLGKYGKAEEYLTKALAITKETGDKKMEAACYLNQGSVYYSLGELAKAEEYQRKALAITKEIGDKKEKATCYLNLGAVYYSFGEYATAEEYQRKALAIKIEIGDKEGEAVCYGNLGCVSEYFGEYEKAEEYQRKALALSKEIGNKNGEAAFYGHLGTLFRSLGKHPDARKYHEKALTMSKGTNNILAEVDFHFELALDAIADKNVGLQYQIFYNLFACIDKSEKMQSFLGRNDQFKISLLEKHSPYYHSLSALLCVSRNVKEAVRVLELGRARALAELISGQHSAQKQISVNLLSWADIERIVKKEGNCSCLYISYIQHRMFLWVLKGNKPINFRKIDVNECFVHKGLERNVDQVFSEESFRGFTVLPQEHCEDRSLSFLKASDSTREPAEEGSLAVYRLVEDEEEENIQPVPTLTERYRMIIAPVADFLDQPELVIVPDRVLYNVPFAALKDESGKYLSQTYRIRIVPSLTTLGIIQDSPADYHNRTGALIVGDPEVRDVYYMGCLGILCALPSAREEAEMIGKLIRAEPLLGKQATKEAVLQSIYSVSLIHFAAHGDAERGEIALAPQYPINGPVTEKDYLLTMADISQVQLRAKLVVLSCCHSAQGHVKAEGVVGIARAFLGSGARSVLVALWAISDEATKKLMSRFYEHLVRGESASESLHQAMEWMRNNGYSDVRDWAPFMLIGDNVTFDFGK